MNANTKVLHETLQRFTFKDDIVILAKSNIDPDDRFIIHAQMSGLTREQADKVAQATIQALKEVHLETVN